MGEGITIAADDSVLLSSDILQIVVLKEDVSEDYPAGLYVRDPLKILSGRTLHEKLAGFYRVKEEALPNKANGSTSIAVHTPDGPRIIKPLLIVPVRNSEQWAYLIGLVVCGLGAKLEL